MIVSCGDDSENKETITWVLVGEWYVGGYKTIYSELFQLFVGDVSCVIMVSHDFGVWIECFHWQTIFCGYVPV